MSQLIPPLRQSTYETMACPQSYNLIHIQGLKSPDTTASFRGTEVHEVLAHYVAHCARERVKADWSYLETLCNSVGEESAAILETCRDGFDVDFQNFLAAEVTLALDANFHPTRPNLKEGQVLPPNPIWNAESLEDYDPAEYQSILDTVYVMPGRRVARIVDYKSHPRPFEPTTFQAKLYSLMLFMHMPELTEVEFVLRFVRYENVHKPIKFFRSDVPTLMDEVRRQKAIQERYHQAIHPENLPAYSGTHCTYCPALQDHKLCPIATLNPMLNLSPAERLRWKLQNERAARVNNKALADWVQSTGEPIEITDANGNRYTFGPVEKEKVTFPLFAQDIGGNFSTPILDALLNWQNTSPEDLVPRKGSKPWFLNLRIGATQLKSYLKAKKRELIHNNIKDLAEYSTEVSLRVSRDAQVDDGKGDEHKEWDASGDDDIQF